MGSVYSGYNLPVYCVSERHRPSCLVASQLHNACGTSYETQKRVETPAVTLPGSPNSSCGNVALKNAPSTFLQGCLWTTPSLLGLKIPVASSIPEEGPV